MIPAPGPIRTSAFVIIDGHDPVPFSQHLDVVDMRWMQSRYATQRTCTASCPPGHVGSVAALEYRGSSAAMSRAQASVSPQFR